MQYVLNRVTEASTHGGLAGVMLSINQIMAKDYAVGVPALIMSLCAIFVPEKRTAL